MKEFEISLEVKAIATIKAKAFNASDAKDAAYHLLAQELINAADNSVTLSDRQVGKILAVSEVGQAQE